MFLAFDTPAGWTLLSAAFEFSLDHRRRWSPHSAFLGGAGASSAAVVRPY